MPLCRGSRIGPYEIDALIGTGGTGDVYRATDTRLHRQVALKVLHETLAGDADRMARFQREATVLASINHRNIAQVYGFERCDPSMGSRPAATYALVMELVEGYTLADRIAEGRIPVDEAIDIAKQIADALETVHNRGIVHRDLKPANIKLQPDGLVKVLDFGLARPVEIDDSSPSRSKLTTITLPAAAGAGPALGTAAYMSPEQARGMAVTRRTDIWSFGCVLFEMLTGTRAFEDVDVSTTLSRVLQREPDFDRLPPDLPSRVRQAMKVCLTKDPKDRAGDIHDVRLAMEGAFEAVSSPVTVSGKSVLLARRALAVVAIALFAGIAIGLTASQWRPRPSAERPVTRFRLALPEGARLNGRVAMSPDGDAVAYAAQLPGNRSALMIRSLDELDARVLLAEDELRRGQVRFASPFFSPDGSWVGFIDLDELALRRVPATGGPARTIASLESALSSDPRRFVPPSAAWVADLIVFNPPDGNGLWQVPAEGGRPVSLTTLDASRGEVGHAFPELLPGEESVLFSVLRGEEQEEIVARNLRTGEQRRIVEGGPPFAYVPSGHLIYAGSNGPLAVPFDARRQKVVGEVVALDLDRLQTTSDQVPRQQRSVAGVSRNGVLVYREGERQPLEATTLVWIDSTGRETPLAAPSGRRYLSPRVSPDGRRVAVRADDDIYVWDEVDGALTRLTFDPSADAGPVWTRDGSRVTFHSRRDGVGGIYWKAADGSGQPDRLLLEASTNLSPSPYSWSPGGDLLFNDRGNRAIGLLRMSGDRPEILLDEPDAVKRRPALSPDGRWLAYQSLRNGRLDVYVRPFPDVRGGGQWQVSPGGGEEPVWAPDSRTIFYVDRAAQRLMSVSVDTTAGFSAGPPHALFDTSGYSLELANHSNYDVGPDGRFLFVKPQPGVGHDASQQLVVVLDFLEELTRLVPAN